MEISPELGVAGSLLLAALGANLAGRWYPAHSYNQMREALADRLRDRDAQLAAMTVERDEYKRLTMELLQNNAQAIRLVEQSTAKR